MDNESPRIKPLTLYCLHLDKDLTRVRAPKTSLQGPKLESEDDDREGLGFLPRADGVSSSLGSFLHGR
jgi:hypothetical protein